jgi:hypothetical protein
MRYKKSRRLGQFGELSLEITGLGLLTFESGHEQWPRLQQTTSSSDLHWATLSRMTAARYI